jgi:hypothetical protein
MHTYKLHIISVFILCKVHYKIRLKNIFLAPNMSKSMQTTLAADARLAERQFLHEEQTLNNAKPLIYRAGSRRQIISKREGNCCSSISYNNTDSNCYFHTKPLFLGMDICC